jgi:hypothetical protein
MAQKIKMMDCVLVEWEDAYGHSRWEHIGHDEPHASFVVRSVGFVIFCDKRGIKLTQGIKVDKDDEDPMGAGVFFIPKGMIRKIKKLRTTTD